MSDLRFRLIEALRAPLPGLDAQLRMAHPDRVRMVRSLRVPDDARLSSVLLLLYPGEAGMRFPLIVRPDYPGVHSGQVALPGGKIEEEDSSLGHTALRETREEIGVHESSVELLGSLTPLYIPPSGFLVHPFIGWTETAPEFRPDPAEVAGLLEVGISRLFDPASVTQEYIRLQNGARITTPAFRLAGRIVWGATAMILSEFREVWQRAFEEGA
jgi:8-oxo-dGTP pyrophosphatase MutT (NUDIX family)